MLKKTVSVFLCFIICFSFFACGNDKNEATESGSTAEISSTGAVTESTTVTTSAPSAAEESTTSAATSSSAETSSESTLSVTETTFLPATSTTVQASIPSTTSSQTTTVSTTPAETVSLVIECKTILDNKDKLNSEKKQFLPSDGLILDTTVAYEDGDTAFDILKKGCAENHCVSDCKWCKNGIQLEYTFTPAFKTYYVEGIHQIYEFDCGVSSGWLYSVNGAYPDVGSSSYSVKSGDKVVFSYSCENGDRN